MQELCDFLIQTPSKTPLLAPRHPADLSNVSCSMLNTPTNYQGKSKRQTAITTAPNLPHPWSCLCPLANPGNSRYAKNTHCYPSQMSYRTWRNSLHSAGICSFTHKATNLPFCPWSSINEQNRITLKKTEGLQNPSPSLPHPNIRKICLFLCFNKGQDYTWSLAGWTWYHSGWLGEGDALLHVPPAAMQLSSAQPFNQAQLSPKDSQQELEEIQPNTPPSPVKQEDCRGQGDKQSKSGMMLLSLPSKGPVIRLKGFLFQEIYNTNKLQILFVKNNSVLQWHLV